MIYLDTHAVIWLYERKLDKFTKSTLSLLDGKDLLLVSPAVKLELQYLYEIDRIIIPIEEMLVELKQKLGLSICDRSFHEIINKASFLNWTRDPFDRLIVASAALGDDLLISKDINIRNNYQHACW